MKHQTTTTEPVNHSGNQAGTHVGTEQNNSHYAVAALLTVSALLLMSLVPGGPIENRDFSHISPLVLTVFNIFLTVLGMGSLLLVPLALKKIRASGWLAVAAGISYLLVYLLDLFAIFPRTPSPMPTALLSIEIIGSVVAIPLVLAGLCLWRNAPHDAASAPRLSSRQLIVISVLAVAIVLFATLSAMHSAG
ncbi:MAG: hypothetical protein ACWA5X_08110 [bacterium]